MDVVDYLLAYPTTNTVFGDVMAGLESFDVRQLKLWRQQILDIYNIYIDVFEEYGLDGDLRSLLNNLDNLLDILSTKLPYQLKIARTKEFLEDLDRFRVYSWRYVGRVAEQLYRDVKEAIDGIFNVEVVEDEVY